MNKVEEFCPEGKKDWRKWLDLNHEKKQAIYANPSCPLDKILQPYSSLIVGI